MSLNARLVLAFGLQALACLVCFAFVDPTKSMNWLVAGVVGIVAGIFGIAYALARDWDIASKIWFIIGSIGVMIGWGSWVVIAPTTQASDPVINITWFAATLGCFLQVLLAMQKPAERRR